MLALCEGVVGERGRRAVGPAGRVSAAAEPGVFGAAVRRRSLSVKEKQSWVIRGKRTRADGKSRRRLSSAQRRSGS